MITERIDRTVKLQDLMREITAQAGIFSPILPQGCKFYATKNTKTVFVIEQSPTVRTLNWRWDSDNTSWKLAFPYIIFIVQFIGSAVNKGYIFYRTKPVTTLKDQLLKTNLCNVYSTGEICTGNVRVEGEELGQKSNSFVANFWQSQFNEDLHGGNYNPAADKIEKVSSLARWQAETKENPLFPITTSWIQHEQTINESLTALLC